VQDFEFGTGNSNPLDSLLSYADESSAEEESGLLDVMS
jgi:hypothetical protein